MALADLNATEIWRLIERGVLAPETPRPGPGHPHVWTPDDERDLAAYERLVAAVTDPRLPPVRRGLGSVTPHLVASVAAWRAAGRPAGWIGLRDGEPAHWASAVDVRADLLRGRAVVAAPVTAA